ncbi:unnamed protein product [Rotaria socialis]
MNLHLDDHFKNVLLRLHFQSKSKSFKIKIKDKIINIDVNNCIYPFEKPLKELNFNLNNPTVNKMNIINHFKKTRNYPLITLEL